MAFIQLLIRKNVLPAQAGVILIMPTSEILCLSTPRASGGDPATFVKRFFSIKYSPRKRG